TIRDNNNNNDTTIPPDSARTKDTASEDVITIAKADAVGGTEPQTKSHHGLATKRLSDDDAWTTSVNIAVVDRRVIADPTTESRKTGTIVSVMVIMLMLPKLK